MAQCNRYFLCPWFASLWAHQCQLYASSCQYLSDKSPRLSRSCEPVVTSVNQSLHVDLLGKASREQPESGNLRRPRPCILDAGRTNRDHAATRSSPWLNVGEGFASHLHQVCSYRPKTRCRVCGPNTGCSDLAARGRPLPAVSTTVS